MDEEYEIEMVERLVYALERIADTLESMARPDEFSQAADLDGGLHSPPFAGDSDE